MELRTNNNGNSGRAFLATVFFLLLIAVSALFFSYNFRLIKTTSGFHVIEKSDPVFDTPYVDITDWGINELFEYRNITYELINAGYGSEIPQLSMFRHAADQGVQSVSEFNERYGISEGVSDGYAWTVEQMREMDRQYEISQRMNTAMKEAKRIDQEYGISEKVKEGMDKAEEAARDLWEKVNED